MRWIYGESLIAAIERTKGRSGGFDYLRLILSCAVVAWHSARVSYPDFEMSGWLRPTAGMILPMFFALSGYLISGSLVRSRSIHEFVALRAMRIVPALAVETALSAVLIGSLLTTVPWHEFIASPQTHKYLLNIVGYIHFRLPGVFDTNPYPSIVNASLWTIPFELECYALIVVLWITRIVRSRWALLLAAAMLQTAVPLYDLYRHAAITTEVRLPGRILVLSFLFGVILFAFRERVRLSLPIFVVALCTAALALCDTNASYFVGLPAAYVTVYLGLKDPPKIAVITAGDYSYGIYLYSFPIQQTVSAFLPGLRVWYVNLAISLPIAALCAVFSWHVVEKPVLSHRKHWIGVLDRVVDRLRHRKARPDPGGPSRW